jgi:hypothetical protein
MLHPIIKKIEILPEIAPGTPRPKLDFPHLSNSQLVALRKCGKAWHFGRQLHMPSPSNTHLLRGSAVHDGLSAYKVAMRSGATRMDALLEARRIALACLRAETAPSATDAFGRPTYLTYERRWSKGPIYTPQTLEIDVIAALDALARDETIASLQPLSIERGYVIHWQTPNVLPLVGFVDIAYKIDGGAGVLDYKTSTREKKMVDLALDAAQVIYSVGVQADLGLLVREIRYLSIVFKSPGWPYKPTDAADIDIVPSVHPFEAERIERVYGECYLATRMIDEELFTSGGAWECPGCPYRYACNIKFGRLPKAILEPEAMPSQEEIASKDAMI